eukprot:936208-Pyramimonas_sp.AAC.1
MGENWGENRVLQWWSGLTRAYRTPLISGHFLAPGHTSTLAARCTSCARWSCCCCSFDNLRFNIKAVRNAPIGRTACGYILTVDQLDAGRAGIFSGRTRRTQNAPVEEAGPERVSRSAIVSATFYRFYPDCYPEFRRAIKWSDSCVTVGPTGRSSRYILTVDPSDAGRAGIFS